ncbi:MAG: DUF4185 domain-containing protein [Chloroflexota bacterium]|nr:DUF4185 domain-containing protein [Chloroflexota bacterium]
MTNRRRTVFAAVLALVVAATGAAGIVGLARRGGSSNAPAIPFLTERPAAAYLTTLICSILDANGGGAGIRGQDGGTTNVIDGRSYWTFGDTILQDGGFLPNNIGVSSDTDPDNCIDITRKTDASGKAAPLLTKEADEATVWPAAGQVSVQPGVVHFLFNSVARADPNTGTYELNGIGLGKFGVTDLTATRVIDKLIDSQSFPGQSLSATGMLLTDGYVYVYFEVDWNVRVGRVPVAAIEDAASYRYWNGHTWDSEVTRSVDILQTGGGQQAFNVDFNPYLGKWTAMYSTNSLSAIAMAYASAPEGPFTDETILVDCKPFLQSASAVRLHPRLFPERQHSYLCYHPTQHPQFDKNDRQTLYITYANYATYTLWLNRLVLAVPFVQWDDAAGNATYGRQGQAVANATPEGVAFYVPTEPGESLAGIHDWFDPANGVHRLGATTPGTEFVDHGVAFYASTTSGPGLEPVTRWESEGKPALYSVFDLTELGYRATEVAFYAVTLRDQPSFNAKSGYVYWVRKRGGHDFGCCDQTNNPTRQTQDREHEFTLSVDPSPDGYEALVCSPVCGTGGKVVWSGPVTFSPNAIGGKLTLTPHGPK